MRSRSFYNLFAKNAFKIVFDAWHDLELQKCFLILSYLYKNIWQPQISVKQSELFLKENSLQ